MTTGAGGNFVSEGRPPSLLDAILPVVVLILLIALTIVLFSVSGTEGPLQVGLLLSAAVASLVALKNGYSVAGVGEAAVAGVFPSAKPEERERDLGEPAVKPA